ncbi:MAG TPA: preprotein translocase subunit YajC [Burkholderiales bacterium]|nr:preprotein translocase subunit YajC [Burkholderiales bacterium]
MIFAALFSALQAQKPQPQGGPLWGMPVMMIAVFAIFYLLLIMPQRKKQKKHMEMVENLKPGDRIITTAGIFGTVMGVQKDRIELKIAANTKIDVTKSAVGVILGATDTSPEKTG